jgi:molecular chaperone Hsp33
MSPKPLKDLERMLSPYYKEKRRKRDHILKTFTETVRISVINNTGTVAEAKRRHKLSDVATKFVGRAMAAASMLAGWQYGEERIILTFNGNGPLDTVTAEAIRTGEVRAYTTNPKLILPVGTPLGFALGYGSLKVSKILYNHAKPYMSAVPLAKADIASDIEQYYRLSEQIPAHVELETHLNHHGDVIFSGGLIIEALPPKQMGDSNAKFVEPYIERLRHLPPLSVLFGEDIHSLHQVLHKVAPGEFAESDVEKIVTDFHCRCSKDKFKKNLVTLGPDGLKQFFQLAGEEKTLTCHYCNTTYFLTEADMTQLTGELGRLNREAREKRDAKPSE